MPNLDRNYKRLIFTEADLILLALVDGEKRITELRSLTGLSPTTIYNNVRKLLEAKLISEERVGSPGARIIRLTNEGLKIALLLKKLDNEMTPKEYEITPE